MKIHFCQECQQPLFRGEITKEYVGLSCANCGYQITKTNDTIAGEFAKNDASKFSPEYTDNEDNQ